MYRCLARIISSSEITYNRNQTICTELVPRCSPIAYFTIWNFNYYYYYFIFIFIVLDADEVHKLLS